MTFKLSPTALSLMDDCPRCFWLTQHKTWKRPSGIFPSLPNGIDRVLKTHFDGFIGTGELPPELAKEKACKGIKLFDDLAQLEIWRNYRKGLSYTGPKGNVLHGAVDQILQKENNLIVLDYKTRGFPLKEDTTTHYQTQLDIYNFLLRKNGYETEDFAFLLFYVPGKVKPTGEFIFDTTLVKMEIDPQRAENKWAEALNILNGDCLEKKCGWCKRV